MHEYDHLHQQAMWEYAPEQPIPATPGVIGVVACLAAFLGLALTVEL